MRVTTYNIQYCRGRDGLYDVQRIVAALAGADLIGLQEVERYWDRSGSIDQAAQIAAGLPGYDWAYGPTVEFRTVTDGRSDAPPRPRRQFGNMILSRWPLLQVRRHLLPKHREPSGRVAIQRGVVEAVVETPVGPLRVLSTHLDHLGTPARLSQIDMIMTLQSNVTDVGCVSTGTETDPEWRALWGETVSIAEPPATALLMGDFNATPDSPEMVRLLGGEPAMFTDTWPLGGEGGGGGHDATFYLDWDNRAGKRIDYCLATPDLARRVERAWVDRDAIGSDHQPLSVTFR